MDSSGEKSEAGPSKSSKKCTKDLDNVPKFMIWVKDEPFIFGSLSSSPCSKIGVNVLHKVAEYCASKSYYPHLNLIKWGHISKYKVQLPVDLSWAFLRVFDVLSKPLGQDQNFQSQGGAQDAWDVKCENIRMSATGDLDEMKVDTLKFLIFLFIQHINRLHKKFFTRSPTEDDPWPVSHYPFNAGSILRPCMAYSPNTPNLGLRKKVSAEQIQAEFVIGNLADLIDLLVKAIAPTIRSPPENPRRIPYEIVKALGFILGAASIEPHDREFGSLEECFLVLPEVAEAVDFSPADGTVDKTKFILFVKGTIILNPWGPSSTPLPQHAISCLTGIWTKTRAYESNQIFWNTQQPPKGWYLISAVENQVLCLSTTKPLSSLKIHRCVNSYIYVPGVFSSVLIEKCKNCTIFLGPAGKVIKINECERLKVSAVARLFMLNDIRKCNLSILTPCQPIISGTRNRKITFGPYNTFYPKLEEHMRIVNLGVNVNKWNKPIELGSHGMPIVKGQLANYGFLNPEKYRTLVFPFEMEGSTKTNPVALTGNYLKNEMLGEERLEILKNLAKDRKLSTKQTIQFNAIVQTRFKDWLKQKETYDELKGLRSMQHAMKVGSQVPILESPKPKKKLSEKEKRAQRKLAASLVKLNLQESNAEVDDQEEVHTTAGGSGDLTASEGSKSRSSCVSSSSSFVSSIVGGSFHGLGQPGVLEGDEDYEDDVFVGDGEVEDFSMLDSICLFDDMDESDVKVFDVNVDEEEYDQEISAEYKEICSPPPLMDDGSNWKFISN